MVVHGSKVRACTKHKSHKSYEGFVEAQAKATKLLAVDATQELVQKVGDLFVLQQQVNRQVRAAAVGQGRLHLERHCLDLEDLTRLTHEVLALAFVK